MPTFKELNKENLIKGPRKVKSAPDFSKLHKQWNEKLQKGKAVAKKPLTDVNPFQFSHPNVSKTNRDDFYIDKDAKQTILNCEGIAEKSLKPQRATIAVTRRNSIKTKIPRSSFSTKQRSSLFSKTLDNSALGKQSNAPFPVTGRVVVPKPTPISKSPMKKIQNAQGFGFDDFKVDADALESILNCKGLPHGSTPTKLSSQFGPSKTSRVKGRIVPYQGSAAASRLSTGRKAQMDTAAANTLAAKRQRWSIYSRDSFTAKPDLMTWLKELIDQPAPKRNSLYAKPNPKILPVGSSSTTTSTTEGSSTTSVTGETRSSFYIQQNDTLYSENSSLVPPRSSFYSQRTLPTIAEKKNMALANHDNVRSKFDQTLVGYQGGDDSVFIKTASQDDVNSALFNTPTKNKLSAVEKNSIVKSILKKNMSGLKETEKEKQRSVSMNKTSSLTTPSRTPIRLSAYARNQKLLGLPLPKENRYEMLGQHITSPLATSNDEMSTPFKLAAYKSPCDGDIVSEVPSTLKRVRWADTLKETEEMQSTFQSPPSVAMAPSVLTDQKHAGLATDATVLKASHRHSASQSSVCDTQRDKSLEYTQNTGSMCDTQREKSQEYAPNAASSMCDAQREKSQEYAPNASWATILSVGNNKSSASRNLSGQFNMPTITIDETKTLAKNTDKTSKSTSNSSRRNKNRNSILERIYGDAITFALDESTDETKSNTFANASSSSRPTPLLDRKVIEDLISFKDDDVAEDCADFYSNNDSLAQPFQSTLLHTPMEAEYREPLSMTFTPLNEGSRCIPEAPCKTAKAKARTPYKQAMLDYLDKMLGLPKESANVAFDCTVVDEKPIDENLMENERIVESEYDKEICAEDPNVLHETQLTKTVEIKEESSNKSSQDCNHTIVGKIDSPVKQPPGSDFTSSILHQLLAESISSSRVDVKCPVNHQALSHTTHSNRVDVPSTTATIIGQQLMTSTTSRLTSSVVNILSPTMRKFPVSELPNSTQDKSKSNLPPGSGIKNRRRRSNFTSVNGLEGSVLKPATFQLTSIPSEQTRKERTPMPTPVEKKTNTADHMLTLKLPETILKPSMLATRMSASAVSSNIVRIDNPIRGASSGSHPLFGGDALFAGSLPVDLNNTKHDESSVYEDSTDVCLVISKPKFIPIFGRNENESVTSNNLLNSASFSEIGLKTAAMNILPNELSSTFESHTVTHESHTDTYESHTDTHEGPSLTNKRPSTSINIHSSDNVTIGLNSAFRRVPPKCNMFPRVHASAPNFETSSEMIALRHLVTSIEKYHRQRSSMLDAEISLYSKFGEISERFGKRKLTIRDGSTCAVATLLTHGDSMHFVPVDAS